MTDTEKPEISFFLFGDTSTLLDMNRIAQLTHEEVSHLSEVEREFFTAVKSKSEHFSMSAITSGTRDQEVLCRSLLPIVKFRPQILDLPTPS